MMDDVVDRALALGGECDRGFVLLVAMIADEIQTLARMHRRGIWKDDPSEIGEWLRTEGCRKRKNSSGTYDVKEAHLELQLWGGATDSLIRAIQTMTPVRMSRETLLRLAKEHSGLRVPGGKMGKSRSENNRDRRKHWDNEHWPRKRRKAAVGRR